VEFDMIFRPNDHPWKAAITVRFESGKVVGCYLFAVVETAARSNSRKTECQVKGLVEVVGERKKPSRPWPAA
jgi:hypothetical protein